VVVKSAIDGLSKPKDAIREVEASDVDSLRVTIVDVESKRGEEVDVCVLMKLDIVISLETTEDVEDAAILLVAVAKVDIENSEEVATYVLKLPVVRVEETLEDVLKAV
jgi:hypothetical protein